MNSQDFLTFIHDSLPKFYWAHDLQGELDRFLEALYEGGYLSIIEGENNLLDLIDPYTCPDKILPVFCNSFGLDYYPNIPPKYHRKLLANIGELNRRRGTYYCVRFLCRVLTGMEIDMRYEQAPDHLEGDPKILYIDLLADSLADVSSIDVSIKVVSLFIMDFIPYFIKTVNIKSVIDDVVLEIPVYRSNYVTFEWETVLPTDY